MTLSRESTYWETNPEWYRFNKQDNNYELTDKAPERARKSFELFMMPRAEREKMQAHRKES